MKKKIDFICLGASKSGTTAIANFLSRNPNIFCPSIKEVNYFNEFIPQDYSTSNVNFIKSAEWYNSHFKFDETKKIINGELTPCYLNSIKAVKKIKQYNPDIKLFVILRDPVYRAYSQYLYAIQNGVESNTNFLQALQDKPKKYMGESMYYENLSRYYGEFKKSQIKIFLYEDFFKDVNKSMEDLFKFIGAEHKTSFDLESEFVNKGKAVRFPALNRLIGRSNILLKNQKFEKLRDLLKQTGVLSLIKFIKSANLTKRNEVVNELKRDVYEQAHLIFEKDINSLKNKLNLNVNSWGFKENKSV
jgi:hypothetical protein